MVRRGESFGSGFSRGFDRTFAPSMQEVLSSSLAERVRKQFNLDRDLLQEHEDERESKSLQESLLLDTEMTAEDKMPYMQQFEEAAKGKRGLSKESRDRITESVSSFKQKKSSANSTAEAERKAREAAEAEIKDEYESQLARIQTLPEEQRKRFAPYQAVEKPTRGRLNALKDDLGLFFEESKTNRSFENQLKLKEAGSDKGGGAEKVAASDRPKTAKEMLDKAYQDYRAVTKDADELNMISRLVGVDNPAGEKRSFRDYLENEWLSSVGRVFNADVADSMQAALKSGKPAAAPSGAAGNGVSAPAANPSGSQVPDDLVARARQALDSIERQIQALEAKR